MILLVLGGARSGKSEVGERLATSLGRPVTYVATCGPAQGDEDMARRVAAHRLRRPAGWSTVEVGRGGDLPGVAASLEGTALIDSLGTWLAGLEGFAADAEELRSSLRSRLGDTVVVSEEVGLGVHPSSAAGRAFRDRLGELNRALAEAADEVLLVVAGRTLRLGEGPASHGGGRGRE